MTLETTVDDELISEAVWRLGRGAQHLRLTESQSMDTPEFAALTEYWTTIASLNPTRDSVARLLELAREVPDYPETALNGCADTLSRLP